VNDNWRKLLVLAFLLFGGCNSLPPGDVSAIHNAPALSRQGNVILLRGWRGLYSTGIDQLADELRAQGVQAIPFRESQWRDLVGPIVTLQHDHASSEPLVLIGFSYGADNAIALSRELDAKDVRVTLLITIDPVTPPKVPIFVVECYNFYRSNGVWDVFPFFRGVPLEADPVSRLPIQNINLQDHPELDDPGMGHTHIAGSAKVHQAIIAQVLKLCPPREAQRPTTRNAVE